MLRPGISKEESMLLRTELAYEMIQLWKRSRPGDDGGKAEPSLHRRIMKRIGRIDESEIARTYVYLMSERTRLRFDEFYSVFRKTTRLIPFMRMKGAYCSDAEAEYRLREASAGMSCQVRKLFEILPGKERRLNGTVKSAGPCKEAEGKGHEELPKAVRAWRSSTAQGRNTGRIR